MPLILLLVIAGIIGVYLYGRSKDKFTRGGDINRQGEEMKDDTPGSDDDSD